MTQSRRNHGSLLAFFALFGCTPTLTSGGVDISYLKDIDANPKEEKTSGLLPLAPGNYWDMTAISESEKTQDKIVVVGPIQINGTPGTLVKLIRNGVLWRQEVYRSDNSGIWLLAYGEKQVDLLQLSPPMPLLNSTFREGSELHWSGKILFKKESYLATGYCRITGQESLQTPTGRFQAYHLDSVISMLQPGKPPLHFPSIRWLSRDIGFIRRSFADGGKPAVQELNRYMVKGGS